MSGHHPAPPEGLTESERIGFRLFWTGWTIRALKSDRERRGWWLAYARAYGQGVAAWAAFAHDHNPDGLAECPYVAEGSAPREAWLSGHADGPSL